MIPERLDPGLSPNGVVVIAFDRHGEEVTRSVLGADSPIEFLAEDAGDLVRERGGGTCAAYDGDSGQMLFRGPNIIPGEPTTVEIDTLLSLSRMIRFAFGELQWTLVGVFPTADEPDPGAWWNAFVYSVGMPDDTEVWAAMSSIEGRFAGHDLTAMIVNLICCGVMYGVLRPGDSVRIPLGIADADPPRDEISVWWIGDPEPAEKRSVNMTVATRCLPVLWSSPLGFKEEP